MPLEKLYAAFKEDINGAKEKYCDKDIITEGTIKNIDKNVLIKCKKKTFKSFIP